jgi:hypothetical protein
MEARIVARVAFLFKPFAVSSLAELSLLADPAPQASGARRQEARPR